MNVLQRQLLWMVGIAVVLSTSAMADHGAASVSGFVDGQIIGGSLFQSPSNSPTFVFNEGAVYATTTVGGGTVFLDIPVSGGNANNNFNIAQGKAQAYINFKYDVGLWWRLGQFDTIYGLEANDTKDITFTRHSSLYSFRGAPTSRVTHTGLMVGYNFTEEVWFKALASNPLNQGIRSTTTAVQNFEYGGVLGYNGPMFHLSGGILIHKPSTETEMLLDFVLGTKIEQLTLDLEFLLAKSAVLNSTSGFGIMGHFVYAINDEWSLGLRPELLSKLVNNVDGNTRFQITFGPQAKVTDHLTCKLDYTFRSDKASSAATASTSSHGFGLAAVHTF